MEALTDDVFGLIGHAGEARAHVVGHDWGGAIAWALAMRRPEAVGRLAVLNAPAARIVVGFYLAYASGQYSDEMFGPCRLVEANLR
jgi:pimeloyl-ACP methyl ester carboxylesterase